ncbi:MAG: TetR/AcrR family transcriptional regulator [Desulfobacterales bacterium]|nr:TetR/AcrR family transcriptional regulator [Desulfobacterales bacterium]
MAKSVLKQLKENEREVRRKLIINAAKSLFTRKSFHEIGMRDIANEAGISVASLYQYFPSQDDLFVEILTTDITSVKYRLWKEHRNLEDVAIDIVTFLVDHEDIFQMMSHFMIKGEKNPETLRKFHVIQVLFLDILDEALSRAEENQQIRYYSHAFFASLFGNVITFRNYPSEGETAQRENLNHVARITARAFNEALLSSPPLN